VAATLLCAILGLLSAPPGARAQQEPELSVPPPAVTQELELRDGSVLYGRVESIDAATVVFRTVGGSTLTVSRADIAAIRPASGRLKGEEFLPADPNATRLFFGPTGRSLPRGQAYLGVYEILLPFVQVGLTDRLSVGAGTPLMFGFEGEHPVWVTPKLQVYSGRRVQVAAGLLHAVNVGDGQFGIAYGVATAGQADNSVTAGVGWSYWRCDDACDPGGQNQGAVIVMVGAERRVSRRIKLITENYMWGNGAIMSGGVRFIGGRLSADLGLAMPFNVQEAVVLPIVNFVWAF
jgi:hypothetical protein